MVITEVRIKLIEGSDENGRLQAFCSVTFNDVFVVRDLKVIEGSEGAFVAMPSRKITDHCTECGAKNHLRASYCNACGNYLDPERALRPRANCPNCGRKNPSRTLYTCDRCKNPLDDQMAPRDKNGRVKLHADTAHPINSACREVIQTAVLKAFHAEQEQSRKPDYVCTYKDFEDYRGWPGSYDDLDFL